MSDPVTNVEIEDVLSSIRRLVAEGDKAKRAKPAPEPEKPERLVLTPALRVSKTDDDSQVGEQASDPVTADTPMAFVAPDRDEVDATDGDPLTDITSGDGQAGFDRARLEQSNIPFDRANLEATIAELEAAVTEQADEWEPDGSETDTDPSWASAGFPSDQPVEDAEIVAETDEDVDEAERWDAAPVAAFTSQQSEATDPAPLRLQDPITEPQVQEDVAAALQQHSADVPEPEEDLTGDVGIPPLTFRHAADHGADEDHGDDLRPGDDPQDDDIAAFLTDDTVIDEAVLRQLVLEIVREELQGKLGERITRNVRKLVRREIHRVLTSQDYD